MLEGEDFIKTFRLDVGPDPAFLPLFAELVRVDRMVLRAREELTLLSRGLLAKYLARRPSSNPIRRFGDRFALELPLLQAAGMAHYHQWAFSTIRQLGAAFELAALHLAWLAPGAKPHTAALAFEAIARLCKTLILKAARAVNSGRTLDASPLFDEMAAAWDRGMAAAETLAHSGASDICGLSRH